MRVDCYSGYRGDERPIQIWLGSKKIEVREIVNQWISPDHRCFKIKGDDNNIYTICHDLMSFEWTLQSKDKERQ